MISQVYGVLAVLTTRVVDRSSLDDSVLPSPPKDVVPGDALVVVPSSVDDSVVPSPLKVAVPGAAVVYVPRIPVVDGDITSVAGVTPGVVPCGVVPIVAVDTLVKPSAHAMMDSVTMLGDSLFLVASTSMTIWRTFPRGNSLVSNESGFPSTRTGSPCDSGTKATLILAIFAEPRNTF